MSYDFIKKHKGQEEVIATYPDYETASAAMINYLDTKVSRNYTVRQKGYCIVAEIRDKWGDGNIGCPQYFLRLKH